jgi:hypothetical protein
MRTSGSRSFVSSNWTTMPIHSWGPQRRLRRVGVPLGVEQRYGPFVPVGHYETTDLIRLRLREARKLPDDEFLLRGQPVAIGFLGKTSSFREKGRPISFAANW